MTPLCGSFFFGGFEGTAGWIQGRWVDAITATRHDCHIDGDYALLARHGMACVRESIRWPLIEEVCGHYDFSSVLPFARGARRHGLDVLWDLFHFGYPRFTHPLDPAFPDIFSDYCRAAAIFLRDNSDGPFLIAPVNEPSFYAFAAGTAARFAPYLDDAGWELKVALARAAISGVHAIRAVLPHCRVFSIDPLCRVVAPPDDHSRDEEIRDFNERLVFQSWDMLSGKLLPELGGSPDILDVVGINYYWTNQWEYGRPDAPLHPADPRHAPLHELVRTAWERYGRDLIISETSHWGEARAAWLSDLEREALHCLSDGLALRGICIYPAIGMFDWYDGNRYAPMGLWDLDTQSADLSRVPHSQALDCVARLGKIFSPSLP